MTYIHVVILGIVEGITEFLPISSTAHLIISSRLLNIPQTEFQKFFEVFIQGGAILAVITVYLNYILKNKQMMKKVIISFIPTAILGVFLYRWIKSLFFESFFLIGGAFLIIGIGFLLVEYFVKKKKLRLFRSIKRLDSKEALVIGLAQSLAVIPGVSRAGIVLMTMMLMGYKRDEAAIYSFLLAVPTILAAGFFDFYKSRGVVFSNFHNLYSMILGFAFSFIFAYLSIRWLIGFLQKNNLLLFGFYRIIIAFFFFML